MSTDRELLERAAKAAGVEGNYMEVWGDAGIAPDRPDGGLWNPLTDDGDALRLMVKLDIAVYRHGPDITAEKSGFFDEELGSDPCAAARRAIVRAAAEIGRSL